MDLHEAIRRRAMVRSFAADPVDPAVVDPIVPAALRAPSAGNTGGPAWIVLAGPAETARYWEATTDQAWRTTSPRAAGLRRAPVILLAYASARPTCPGTPSQTKPTRASGHGPDARLGPCRTGPAMPHSAS